jgi:signal transduction histidine kinase
MTKNRLETEFAPAERVSEKTIEKQFKFVRGQAFFREVLDLSPDPLMVLNKERQTVYANQVADKQYSWLKTDVALGHRPGEIWGCEYAAGGGGCGTKKNCRNCGAVQAVLRSQKGKNDMQECRITRVDGDALDLRVWTTPLRLEEEQFTVLFIKDISDEKRRRVLERIFFHDINNIATGFQAFNHFFKEESDPEEIKQLRSLASKLTQELVEEIGIQQAITSAENFELAVNPSTIDAHELLEEVVEIYKNHRAADQRQLKIGTGSESLSLQSDKTLLRRVLSNLVKNALEASDPGETVTIACRRSGDGVAFSVHNPKDMPENIQSQIFKRSFSTKGKGRGLGTYSVRLLSERYLGGKVSFDSSPEDGTTFTVWYPTSLEVG